MILGKVDLYGLLGAIINSIWEGGVPPGVWAKPALRGLNSVIAAADCLVLPYVLLFFFCISYLISHISYLISHISSLISSQLLSLISYLLSLISYLLLSSGILFYLISLF